MSVEQCSPQLALQLNRWHHRLLGAACLFSLLMTLISWLAYWQEGATIGLYALGLWLFGAALAGYWLYHFPQTITLRNDEIVVTWLGRRAVLAVSEIRAIEERHTQLIFAVADRRLRCTVLLPNDPPSILSWLEEQSPAIAALHRTAVPQTLPLILTPRLVAPVLTAAIILIFGLIGGGLLWTSWRAWQLADGSSDTTGMMLFGILLLLFAGFFLYLLLDTYIWRISLGTDFIERRHTFHTERYPAGEVTAMTLVAEERTIKGIVHQVYMLRLALRDGATVDIAPNLPNFPMDYAGAAERRLLSDVQAVLADHYRPVVRLELDPATLADPHWGAPVYAIQWQIRPYDVTVTRLDYGEHHAAASTVHLLVGHSEAGAIRFRTTNGESKISPDGRYLAIYDTTLLIIFNLGTGRTYHRNSRQDWLYAQVTLADEMLLIEEMRRTNASERAVRKPISLEKPTSALRRGFGSAIAGDFPSAYG